MNQIEALTVDEVRKLLREHIGRRYGSGAAAGRAWGVSTSVVSDVLCGRRPPHSTMLAELGLTSVVVYRKAH